MYASEPAADVAVGGAQASAGYAPKDAVISASSIKGLEASPVAALQDGSIVDKGAYSSSSPLAANQSPATSQDSYKGSEPPEDVKGTMAEFQWFMRQGQKSGEGEINQSLESICAGCGGGTCCPTGRNMLEQKAEAAYSAETATSETSPDPAMTKTSEGAYWQDSGADIQGSSPGSVYDDALSATTLAQDTGSYGMTTALEEQAGYHSSALDDHVENTAEATDTGALSGTYAAFRSESVVVNDNMSTQEITAATAEAYQAVTETATAKYDTSQPSASFSADASLLEDIAKEGTGASGATADAHYQPQSALGESLGAQYTQENQPEASITFQLETQGSNVSLESYVSHDTGTRAANDNTMTIDTADNVMMQYASISTENTTTQNDTGTARTQDSIDSYVSQANPSRDDTPLPVSILEEGNYAANQDQGMQDTLSLAAASLENRADEEIHKYQSKTADSQGAETDYRANYDSTAGYISEAANDNDSGFGWQDTENEGPEERGSKRISKKEQETADSEKENKRSLKEKQRQTAKKHSSSAARRKEKPDTSQTIEEVIQREQAIKVAA